MKIIQNENEQEMKSDESLQEKITSKEQIGNEDMTRINEKLTEILVFLVALFATFAFFFGAFCGTIEKISEPEVKEFIEYKFYDNVDYFIYEFDEHSENYILISGTPKMEEIAVYFNSEEFGLTLVDVDSAGTISLNKEEDYYIYTSYCERILVKLHDNLLFMTVEFDE